ncbi:MAG: hypothetical protein ACLQU2_23165, partial [Candidatus Binataceae bacterium]
QLETSSNITLNETPDPRIFPTAIRPWVFRLRHMALPVAQRYMSYGAARGRDGSGAGGPFRGPSPPDLRLEEGAD